jgi:cytosine/adenosine deaminase-related metal-dependent hydrolase
MADPGFVDRWQGHPRITPAIAPHARYTVADDHLIEAQAFAVDRASPLIIH